MKPSIPIIIIVEGGVVQHVYCPDPESELEVVILDYDNEQAGSEGLEELVARLQEANQLEQRYDYQPSIAETLKQKTAQLAAATEDE